MCKDTDIYKSTQTLDVDALDGSDTLPSSFKEPSQKTSLTGQGKYREIIYAIVLFLVIDLGVLVLNFYTSFQMVEDALSINLSGRQRMLSQQITKSLYAASSAHAENDVVMHDAISELSFAVDLFDVTLVGLDQGAYAPDGDMKNVWLNAVTTKKGRRIIEKTKKKWSIYKGFLTPILENDFTDEQLKSALKYSSDNNVKFLELMNELTTELEVVTNVRAKWLRVVQSTGIILAFLNFIFIMYKLIRGLGVADAKLETVHRENEKILSGVREGLFLITPDLQLGKQISSFSKQIFGELRIRPGVNFVDLLIPLLTPKVINDVQQYIGLLFDPYVNESIMRNLNPLGEIEVFLKNHEGVEQKRQLTFQFTRIMDDDQDALDRVRHLLVTVQDVTDLRLLQEKFQIEKQRTRKEFYRVFDELCASPVPLKKLLENARTVMQDVRDFLQLLEQSKDNEAFSEKLPEVEAAVQALRAEASKLPLDLLVSQLYDLELQLLNMRYRSEAGPSGFEKGTREAFITLDEIDEKLHSLSKIPA